MEHYWPQIPNAFAIPFRKFQQCRDFLMDLLRPEGFWETEEGEELHRIRDEMEEKYAKVRLA